jgi:uncharacterized protein (DUF433 family)
MDWSQCPDVERIPGKVSGAWLVKGTRLPVWAILENADDHTPEEIANEIFEGVTPETVRRIIIFAVASRGMVTPPRQPLITLISLENVGIGWGHYCHET